MLIRTNQVMCKVRIAVAVRVILFFGIPLCYFFARHVTSVSSPSLLLKFDSTSGKSGKLYVINVALRVPPKCTKTNFIAVLWKFQINKTNCTYISIFANGT